MNIMREFSRVTKQWVVLSFYHYYCFKHLKKILRNKAQGRIHLPFKMFKAEAEKSGLSVVQTYAVSRFYEPQWIVLLKKQPHNDIHHTT